MPDVDSQAIGQVEYDARSRTLFVRFAGGGWYAYRNVPAAVYRGLLGAESKGRFFQASIRDAYAFVRLAALSPPDP